VCYFLSLSQERTQWHHYALWLYRNPVYPAARWKVMDAKMAAGNKENGGWQQLQVWLLLFWPGCGSLLMINSYDPHWLGVSGGCGGTSVAKWARCQHTCVHKCGQGIQTWTHTYGRTRMAAASGGSLWQHSAVLFHADGPTKPPHTHSS